MIDQYRQLLADAAILFERHEAGRPEPFNVFSVLRSESDEVNLHSRFLAALLDHRKPGESKRHYLAEFLKSVANVKDFKDDGVNVERERHHIDVLITNAERKAVVIENKIRADDQRKQLQRYYDEMKRRSYSDENIHLRYLTLFGHDPSSDSLGSLPRDKVEKIAYKDDAFQNWLRCCQQRAFDEPALRESIGQYLWLVQKLTGTDRSEAYMSELRDLCLEKENLVLVHDLKSAMDEAWIELIVNLFAEIESELSKISDLPEKHDATDVSRDRIRELVTPRGRSWLGLYYGFREDAQLGIQFDVYDCLFYGIRCNRDEAKDTYYKIMESLGGSNDSDAWWPKWEFPNSDVNPRPRNPERDHLRYLADKEQRDAFVSSVAGGAKALWERIQKEGLA